ncbi:uncharacterized protein PAN0_092c6680 [Moesziomyces antarcticus]|uniref:Uncharacterized protein n=2 Tax=Pseudozyma antarctica TaxID=84753 RepID=A0A5C3FSW0_PSEA2|nr:uncharacterized protein PAN0_092c6680 [Moesziomyces antarcticus]GAK68427.1 hypothetical protein PAN0_092c6680 [Moesziomyces antarcticus]SPO47392.1 uncharacterized protein PSANT_05080 [Moesziomyces antarcticus]
MLHHSCARCRTKKIRCDGASPCAHCVDNQVADECKRVMRKSRTRKDASKGARSVSSAARDSFSFNRASPYSSSHRPLANAAQPVVTSEAETASFVAQQARTSTRPYAASMTSSVPDLDVSGGSRSRRVSAELAQRARETIGDLKVAERMIDTHFYWRCSSMVYSCIHLPTLQLTLPRLYSPEVSDAVGEDELAVVLLVLAMAIQFAPHDASESDLMPMCQDLGASMTPLERQNALHALAAPLLQRMVFSSEATLQQLQACILTVVYDLDSAGFKEQMRLHAVRAAQTLRLDHINADVPVTVDNEMGVRAWWFLVCRDWFVSPQKGSYLLHPHHFTTRMPLMVSDEALERIPLELPLPSLQEPSDKWLPVRWMEPLIRLATLVRSLVDEKLRSHASGPLPFHKVEKGFSELIDALPRGFRIDEIYLVNTGQPKSGCQERYSIERWLLHQAIFAAMLGFYEVQLGEAVSAEVVTLANHILDLQGRLRHRCNVVNSLRINVDSVVRASMLICTDLMHQARTGGSSLARQISLGRVREAMVRVNAQTPATQADVEFVSTLLRAEARLWEQHRTNFNGSFDGMVTLGGGSTTSSASIATEDHSASSLSVFSAPLTPLSIETGADVRMGSADSPAHSLVEASMRAEAMRTEDSKASMFPKDTGICPALHVDSAAVDKLWKQVIEFLQESPE